MSIISSFQDITITFWRMVKIKGKHVHKIIIPGYNYHFLDNGAVDSCQHGQTQGLQSKLKRNLNETVNGNLNETPSMSGDLCLYIHNYIQIDISIDIDICPKILQRVVLHLMKVDAQ